MRTLLTAWLALCLTAASAAQTSRLVPDAGGVTAEELAAALDRVTVEPGLDGATRDALTDQLRQAQVHLRSRQSSEAAAASYADAVLRAPEETRLLRAKLDGEAAAQPTPGTLGIGEQTPTPVLEGMLGGALVEL
ncbi:MAG: hypothetical protein AAGF23_14735, partial [Acidobacteriota bacterium]